MLLYEPIKVGGIELRNRIVWPPCVMFRADMQNRVTDSSVNFYTKIAKGGVGLVVIEAVFINPIVPGLLCIYDDSFIPGLKRLVDAVHAEGAKISIQLIDPMPLFYSVDNIPLEWIQMSQFQYAQAARRAKEAGFDFVELHGAHGYIISYFLSLRNKRRDEYGGKKIENRMRFVNEVIDGIRAECGDDFPIGIRLNADEFITGGNTLKHTREMAKILSAEKGLVYLNLTAGGKHEDAINIVGNQLKWPYAAPGPWKDYHGYSGHRSMPPNYMPDGVNIYLHADIKEAVEETTDDFDKRAKIFACGKIPTPEFANTILEEGKGDCVSVCRAILCDSEWPNKGKEGRSDEIVKCVYCNQCMKTCGEGCTQCVQWKEKENPMEHFGFPPFIKLTEK
jgi:2,4-dienoyl-CoA reductase-like NADH-dependent reductase (Old Yellow Enzyme family)